MAVPFSTLIPARSRVLPQGGAVLGAVTGSVRSGFEAGRLRAAEEAAPDLLLNYLDSQGAAYAPLGSLTPGGATGYVAGPGSGPAPAYNGTPTRENAATQAALTPGDPSFDGRFAMRRENASQQNPAPAPSGNEQYRNAISNIESGGSYTLLGPIANASGDRAYGRYQVMGANVGPWTEQALGVRMTPEQFLADPAAQDAVFDHIFGGYVQQYGPEGAARAWFTGSPTGTGTDVLGTTADRYVEMFRGGGGSAGGAPLAGGAPAAGGGYGAPQPAAWSPPTGAERAQLRALMINPATRQMGYQLAIQRMTPPAPVQPNYGFTEVGGVLYRTDPATGQVAPVTQGAAAGPTWQPITDPTSGWTGRQNTATGDVEWNPAGMQPQAPDAGEPPTDIQVYDYYVSQERSAGREPKSFNDWDLERRGRLGGIDPTVAEQRYNLLYQNAARELPILEETWASLSDVGNQAADRLPAIIGNWIVSPDYQRALSAMTQVVQMQTYALTGAAATESEAQRIARTLLPAIGDGPGVIADKLQRTRDAIDFIRGASGPAGAPAAPAPPPPAPVVTPAGAGGPPPTLIYDPATGTLIPVTP